jgi:hypothetical protein
MVMGGFINGIRYFWSAQKIREVKTAKSHSRKSMNVGIGDDLIKFLYGLVRLDLYIISSTITSLIFMIYKWFTIYRYYPYRKRGLINFKRPSLLKYFINSLIPNKKRKRL